MQALFRLLFEAFILPFFDFFFSAPFSFWLPSVQVKKLVDSGMLTSSNANEMQEVCEKLMVDEITLKSFVQHREFLALKAQKREAERNTLPDINWKEENEVKSLTSRQIKIYLKQNNLHVSGSKAALVGRALDFSHTGTPNNERNKRLKLLFAL